MPIHNENDDLNYTREGTREEIQDESGRIIRVKFFNKKGILETEITKNKWGRNAEVRNYYETGELFERIVYDYDQFGKLLRYTDYDSDGDIKYIKEEGKAPQISEKWRGDKPFTIATRPRNKQN